MAEKLTTEYIGDGVYAEWDGHQIRLWTAREHSIHEIYLDSPTYTGLLRFVARIGGKTKPLTHKESPE